MLVSDWDYRNGRSALTQWALGTLGVVVVVVVTSIWASSVVRPYGRHAMALITEKLQRYANSYVWQAVCTGRQQLVGRILRIVVKSNGACPYVCLFSSIEWS